MILRRIVILLLAAGLAGCAAVERKTTMSLARDLDLIIVNTGFDGNGRPGLSTDRAFLRQKDSDDNTVDVRHVDSVFASEPSTKSQVLGIVNTGVQGGLQAITAGQFKVPRNRSNVSMSSGPIDLSQQQQSTNSAAQDNNNTANGGSVRDFTLQGGAGGAGGNSSSHSTANGGVATANGGQATANGGSIHDFSVGTSHPGGHSGPPRNRPPDNRPPDNRPPHNRPPTKGWTH